MICKSCETDQPKTEFKKYSHNKYRHICAACRSSGHIRYANRKRMEAFNKLMLSWPVPK